MKRITLLLILFISIYGTKVSAHDIEVTNDYGVTIYYHYINDQTELSVTFKGNSYSAYSDEYSGNVIIPSSVTYNGKTYNVKSINWHAFQDCTSLTSVTIPDGMTTIGEDAFKNTGIYNNAPNGIYYVDGWACGYKGDMPSGELVLPQNTRGIGSKLFYQCTGLTSVTIPESVTSIGINAFSGCTGLTSVTIPNSVTNICSNAFYNCTGLTSVVMGNSVTNIGKSAFNGCSSLTKVIVSDIAAWCNITFEDDYSNPLYYVHHLYSDESTEITDLVIPEGVTSIGSYAFSKCTGLTSVTIPNTVTSIGEDAFYDCTGLQRVNITDLEAWCNISFGSQAANPLTKAHYLYLNGERIDDLVIPNSVVGILSHVFSCGWFSSVTIPSTANFYYGSGQFRGAKIGELTLNNPSVDSYAFYYATINHLVVSPTFTYAGNLSFYGATIDELEIPYSENDLTWESGKDSYGMFERATIGTAVVNRYIKQSYGSNKRSAFYRTNISKLTISSHAIYSTDALCAGCRITDLFFDGITEISSNAFYSSSNSNTISNIHLPDGLSSIRSSAFYNCSLSSVIIENETPLAIDGNTFSGRTSATLFVHAGCKATYEAADYWKDFKRIEELPATDEIIDFADANVKAICVAKWDQNGDGELSNREVAVVTNLNYAFSGNDEIVSFNEFRYFTGLQTFDGFGNCSNLQSITIPKSISYFPSYSGNMFNGCVNLLSLKVDEDNTVYDSRNNCNAIIKTETNTLVMGCKGTIIPNDIIGIGYKAFSNSGINSVTIPSNVTSIGYGAFLDCSGLTSVTVDIITPLTIADETFSNRANATLYVPAGSKSAYEAADYWKEFKEIVEMPAPVVNITFADANVKTLCVANWDDNDDGELSEDEAAAVTSLGEVFRGNTEITSFDELQYFTGLTTIDANAFDLCSQLASVVLPPNITTIGCESFKGTALTSVVLPEGVTEIIDRGFADCASMTSVTLPSTLTALRQGAFINCPNLESINLPKSVTTIELAAFRGCSSLNSIDLSEMTVTIAEEAFLGTGLEEVTIPATVTLTGWTNFGWCSNLKMVTVECEGELPSDVFKACAQLETVVLSNASAMRWGSFVDCPKLESVTFLSGNAGDVPYFRNFDGTPDDVMFNVPAGTAESFLKMGYWNLSDLSALPTVKAEFEAEAVAIETMADGISDGDKTTLANAINEARTAVTNADSYASVIEQIDAIKTAAKTYIAGATLEDNTDITAATVINADFNNFTIGWKHGWSQFGIYSTGSLINDDVVLDKFIEAWDPTEGNLFSQTIKSLPAGIYRLEADIVTNPWEPAEVEGVNFFAGNRQKEVVTEANLPQHFSVQFSNNLVGDCMVGIRIADTHSVNYVAMDNVRLYYVCKTADIPQGIDLVSDADARVYLYNVETGKYLNAGHSYGTHAILDETGLPVRLTKNDETNLWQIYFWEGSRYQQLLFDEGENVWVDYNGQGDKSPWWSITQDGDGSYLIQGEAKADTENYLGNNPSRQDMQASYTGVTYTDIISTATVADNIHWRIFTKDDVDLIAAKKSLIATIIRMGESDNVNDDLIASAMSVYEDANASLAAIINAIALLNSQMGMPTEGNSIDMTVLITNPRFENNTTEGWAGANVADGSATPTNYHVHEYFQTNFNMYQTILGVPNGRYLLKWKGFHRPGAKETVAADYAADTDNASAVVYANEVQKTMHNIASDQSDTRLHGTDYETADGFFPDVMEGTRLYFDANHYADQLEVEVTDNVLTIGVKNTENMGERHWVIFSDFELYILENAEQMGNKLAITGGRGVKGGTGKMTVSMANEDEISGIQFRVKLPDGVNFSLTNGKPRITATSRVSGLTVEASKVDDYAQVLIYGMGKSASGNSGDILSLALEVSEELNADEYELELSNIFLTKSDGLVIKQGSVKGTLTVVEPASGDANRDGDVNVGDIIAIANYILGNPSANFDEEAADFNGDGGKPNVGDIIAIANYILGNNSKARKRVNMELDPQ